MAAVPLTASPQLPEGFYAINNQFLLRGPKGFEEFKMLEENEAMFARIDFPGVPKDNVQVTLLDSKKAVFINATAPMDQEHDSYRIYITHAGLLCKCCAISGFTSDMSDGVLRLVLSKTNISPHRSSSISCLAGSGFREDLRSKGPHRYPYGTDPHDPALTGPELKPHPNVLVGPNMAYESKQLENGSLHVRLDMPGVPEDRFTVSVKEGRVTVTGEALAASHDSGGRFYSGDVAMLASPVDIPSRPIKTIIKNGVIQLFIPPV
ncbi:unnamed protein product [Thlaspi arvense]|uniref:SHSP domain-containing protein n=1 Tax=Thlaspi arvense TaxID=13288 RepID=A0AAU9SJ47_THLAR|nr:unnamed protein product [Thlaspi arvense]